MTPTLIDAIPTRERQQPLGGPDGDKLDIHTALIEKHETEHYPIPGPNLIDFLKFRIEQEWIPKAKLVAVLGSPSRVSEILNKQRALTVKIIRRLHTEFAIPAAVLVREYKMEPARAA